MSRVFAPPPRPIPTPIFKGPKCLRGVGVKDCTCTPPMGRTSVGWLMTAVDSPSTYVSWHTTPPPPHVTGSQWPMVTPEWPTSEASHLNRLKIAWVTSSPVRVHHAASLLCTRK